MVRVRRHVALLLGIVFASAVGSASSAGASIYWASAAKSDTWPVTLG